MEGLCLRALGVLVLAAMAGAAFTFAAAEQGTLPSGESVAYYLKALNKNVIEQALAATAAQAQTAPSSQAPLLPALGTSVLPQQPPLTAACIDQMLSKSPAKGTGAYFVQYGQEYGVDPAFALAVFRQENSLCNSDVSGSAAFIGCMNRSIGNIACTTSSCYKGFNTYPNWREGIMAFYSLLKNGSFYIKAGNTTAETIYAKWANVSADSQEVKNVTTFLNEYRAKAKTC